MNHPYQLLKKTDPWAAEWFFATRAALAEPLTAPVPEGIYGRLDLALELALVPLQGAITATYGATVNPVDLFASAFTDKPTGLRGLTPEAAANLARVLGVRVTDEGVSANHDTLVEVAAMMSALVRAGYTYPIASELEDTTMASLPPEFVAPDDEMDFTPLPSAPLMTPEAGLSATVNVTDANGFDWLVTLRRFEPVDGSRFVDFVRQINGAGKYLSDNGYTPRGGSRALAPAPAPAPAAAAPAPAPVPGNGNGNGGNGHAAAPATAGAPAAVVVAAATANGTGEDGGTFPATALVGSMNNGKIYWKITGGRFSRHGLTVWPEVLAASGFDPNALNPATAYNLAGYTVHWHTDENGYKKVTALTPA